VNYFPSRFDPVRHAEKYPIPSRVLNGCREKVCNLEHRNFSLCYYNSRQSLSIAFFLLVISGLIRSVSSYLLRMVSRKLYELESLPCV
jgi:hypothetical protein